MGSATPSSAGRPRVLIGAAVAGPVSIGLAAYAFQGTYGVPRIGSWALWLMLGLGLVWTLVGLWAAPTVLSRRLLLVTLGAAVVARALLLPLPFISSTDAYRYLWDGRVQASGISPYRYAPGDPALEPLREGDPGVQALYLPINRKRSVTIYPPVAQMTFLAANRLGLQTPMAWKVLVLLAETTTLVLLTVLAARRRRFLAYAWNPVPIIGFALAGHLDALVVTAILGAVLAWHHRRSRLIGVALGLAAGFKLWPLALLPAFWRDTDGRIGLRQILQQSLPAVGLLVLSYVPYAIASGRGVAGFLTGGFFDQEGYDDGTRFLALRVLGVQDARLALLLAAGIAVAVGLVVLRSHRDAAIRATWLFGIAVLLTTPYGWYATSLIALAVAGGAGVMWTLFPVTLEAAYLTFFHNVWVRWLGDDLLDATVRRAGLAAVAVILVAAVVSERARRLVLGPWE